MTSSLLQNCFKFVLFTDDMNILYYNNYMNKLIRQTKSELDKLNVCLSVNRLSLNMTKTNYMFFGKSRIEDVYLHKTKKNHN